MKNWKYFNITDYYDISSGLSKSASEFGEGFPFLSFKDVFGNFFVPKTLKELVKTNLKEQEKCSIKNGDIFLTRTSEKVEELGLSCVALRDYPNATFNGFTKRLRPKYIEALDPFFMGFYLRSPKFRADISVFSSLITRASLNNDALSRLKIFAPDYPTQKKIGQILYAYNKLIENNFGRIKLLEEIAQRTYEEWFVKFRVKGEQLPIDEATGLPAGWEIIKVGDLLDKVKSTIKIPSSEILSEGIIPVIDQSRDFVAGYTNEKLSILSLSKPIIVFGDHTRVIKFIDFPFARGADGTQLILSKNSRMPQHLFYHSLLNIDLSNYHYARHFKYLKDSEIIMPSNEYSEKFENLIKPFFEKIKVLRFQNIKLKQSRDILLPRLMSGKINIES
jgi:type I restriction enzyme S subunit